MGKIQELVEKEELNLLRRLRQLRRERNFGILLVEWDGDQLTWSVAGDKEPKPQ